MILLENSILKVDYDPSTDIAVVEYPDLHGFLLPEIKHNIDILANTIRNYDVKKLLLDSTRTIVSVSGDESRDVAVHLAKGIMTTRVEKVARVESPSGSVEERAQQNIKHIQKALPLPFQLKNFTSRAEAMQWLKGAPDKD